jgi:hypothetical protein
MKSKTYSIFDMNEQEKNGKFQPSAASPRWVEISVGLNIHLKNAVGYEGKNVRQARLQSPGGARPAQSDNTNSTRRTQIR